METQHSSHNIYNSINGSHLVEVDVIRRGIMDSYKKVNVIYIYN